MPPRRTPLVNNEHYHVFNRGINKQPIFSGKKDYQYMRDSLKYYLSENPPTSFSKFKKMSKDKRDKILNSTLGGTTLLDVVAYCFMPNHFHIIVQQKLDNGITTFMGRFQNSYVRYYNKSNERVGPLFQGRFKAVRIEDEEQLVHVVRYVHINPATGHVVQKRDLLEFEWSSLPEYTNNAHGICNQEKILWNFDNKERYLKFLLDEIDYKHSFEQISHLVKDMI